MMTRIVTVPAALAALGLALVLAGGGGLLGTARGVAEALASAV